MKLILVAPLCLLVGLLIGYRQGSRDGAQRGKLDALIEVHNRAAAWKNDVVIQFPNQTFTCYVDPSDNSRILRADPADKLSACLRLSKETHFGDPYTNTIKPVE